MRTQLWRALALAGALLFLGQAARAQTQTNVTATIVDPIGIPYSNGTYSVQLIPTGTNPSVNGAGIGGAFNGRLDANGAFNISLWPNASISPGGTLWQFTICIPGGIPLPLGTGGQCTPPTTVTIAGASQSLSATLSAVAPRLTTIFTGPGGVTACTTTGGVAYENGTSNTLTCDGNCLCDSAGIGLLVGPPTSSFSAFMQPTVASNDGQFTSQMNSASGHKYAVWGFAETLKNSDSRAGGVFNIVIDNPGALTNSILEGGNSLIEYHGGGGADATNELWGWASQATLSSAQTVAQMSAYHGFVNTIIAGASVTNLFGYDSQFTILAGSTVGNLRLYTTLPGTGGAGITNLYDYYASTQAAVGTNNYGLYVEDFGSSANDYAIYVVGGKTQIGGPLLFGTNTGAKVLQKTFTLTSPQILNIATTPIQVLPTPGANLAYEIVSIYGHYRFNTTPYTLGGMSGFFFLGNPGSNPQYSIQVAAMIDQAADRFQNPTVFGSPSVSVANQPLFVTGDANPTLGDGTVTFTIQYVIVDVTATT